MKKIPTLTLIAAVAAFAILPISFPVAISVFVTAGILSIAFWDYFRPTAGVRAAMVPARRRERFGLAA